MSARLTERDRMLRQITERELQRQVEGILTAYKWRWFHAGDNIPITSRSGRKYVQNVRAGWPDLFAIRDERALAIELKTEIGKTSPDQDDWLRDLRLTGIECYLWRPRNLEDARKILA